MKKNQIILIIIGVLILIGLVSYFAYWQKIIKSGTSETSSEETPDLCTKFSGILDEITCQRAQEIALEKYPGEVLDITNATTSYSAGKLPEIKTEDRDVWIIRIKLKELTPSQPIEQILPPSVEGEPQYQYLNLTEEVAVAVDRHQAEILFIRSMPRQ